MLFLLCSLVLIILFILIFYCFAFIPSFRTYRIVNKIHGPRGLPFIGNALTVNKIYSFDLLDYFIEICEKYQRLTLIWLLGIPLVLVQEPEDLAEIMGYVTNNEKGFEYNSMLPWLNEGLLVSKGKKWHTRRKLLTPTFHFRILEENLVTMQKHAKVLINKLLEKQSEAVNIHELVTLCALDTMCETAMGLELGAQENPANDYVQNVKTVGELVVYRFQNIYLHREWVFNLTSRGRAFNKSLNYLHTFTTKIIRERKQMFLQEKRKSEVANEEENRYMGTKRKAFLDLLLELDTDHQLTEKDIREEVDTFLFEGHDTTAAAVSFTLFLLALNQDVQRKVVEELESVLEENDEEMLNKQDLNNLRYLEKVIKESLRIFPSVPYISRKISEDVHLKGGVILPAGTNAGILPYILHRNPKIYPDPLKFDPERFSNENMANRHPFAYLPFSAGPRNCIGQKFAMMEVKVFVVYVLRTFHLTAVTKIEDVKVCPEMVLRTEEPIFIRVASRER